MDFRGTALRQVHRQHDHGVGAGPGREPPVRGPRIRRDAHQRERHRPGLEDGEGAECAERHRPPPGWRIRRAMAAAPNPARTARPVVTRMPNRPGTRSASNAGTSRRAERRAAGASERAAELQPRPEGGDQADGGQSDVASRGIRPPQPTEPAEPADGPRTPVGDPPQGQREREDKKGPAEVALRQAEGSQADGEAANNEPIGGGREEDVASATSIGGPPPRVRAIVAGCLRPPPGEDAARECQAEGDEARKQGSPRPRNRAVAAPSHRFTAGTAR